MPSRNYEHGRQPNRCRECKGLGRGGNGFCERDRDRRICRDCGGSQVGKSGKTRRCEHGRIRHTCRACGGSSFCEHGRQRSLCFICQPESVFKRYQHNAKRKGRTFELTFEELKWILSSPCSLCGESNKVNGGLLLFLRDPVIDSRVSRGGRR